MTRRDDLLGTGGVLALLVLAAACLAIPFCFAGCAGRQVRPPDYVEVTPSLGWSDGDLDLSGAQEAGPGPGQPWTGSGDSSGRVVGLALTLGWRLGRPDAPVLERLDALQAAYLGRPAPPPPVVEVPAVAVDPALQAALEALVVAVRRLEETVARQPPPPAPGPPPAHEEAQADAGGSRPLWLELGMAAAVAAAGVLAERRKLPARAWGAIKAAGRPRRSGARGGGRPRA